MSTDDFSADAVPSDAELAKVANLTVFADDGREVTFGSLIDVQKTIVIFVRHFHCSMCQDYVAQLATVRKEALEAANTKLIIIGCGVYQLIKAYKDNTTYRYDIYADPKKDLYVALGMTRRSLAGPPAGEEPKSYMTNGTLGYAIKGMIKGPLRNPTHTLRSGDIQQLGGDFIFVPGPRATLVSRMKHTSDHIEVADLMKAAGVEYP